MGRFKDNVHRFRGLQGQWRLPAFHKFLWDRTFAHAIHGAGSVALIYMGHPIVGLAWLGTFCLYEVQEAKEINDHAYIDLYGMLMGIVPAAVIGAVVSHFL